MYLLKPVCCTVDVVKIGVTELHECSNYLLGYKMIYF